MLGIAQKLFKEKRLPGSLSTRPISKQNDWTLLSLLCEGGLISYIDLAIAQKIAETQGWKNESAAAFICHLSKAVRKGHLCVSLQEDAIVPSCKDLADDGEVKVTSLDQFEVLVRQGADIIGAELQPWIVKHSNHFYFTRQWKLKTAFEVLLVKANSLSSLRFPVDLDKVHTYVQERFANNELLEEQARAVIRGCQSPFSIITGGPGTGKTYTAGMLLKVIWRCMDPKTRTSCRFALAAPTGKAAAQLESSIKKALGSVDGFPPVRGETLHGLLGMGRRTIARDKIPLAADVLLVDECSMIDGEMMVRLFESLKPGARVIMLGDPYQLPPVEVGTLFADMVEAIKQREASSIPLTELNKCMRSDLQEIVKLAEIVKKGESEAFFTYLTNNGKCDTVSFSALEDTLSPRDIQKKLVNEFLPYYQLDPTEDFSVLLSSLNRFRLLSPLRQGPLGVDALNTLFYQTLSAKKTGTLVIPIMIATNNYRLGLCNGEVGLLIKHDDAKKSDVAIFRGGSENEVRQIPAVLLPKYEYAYCLSIHKSQGSEFEHVLLLYPKEAVSFGREAFYTGITRAKKKLTVWCDVEAMKKTIQKSSLRQSGIIF